ncbi:putative 3',5'-cyclic phosphodiesterase pde-5 [Armadillidium nasatum]|uniref:Putative 3',5'-cyclic phosphodiesterase pde-5 n=1 Tax=Armadillidium nasatum TaxID=96803 RepID=A0A5N5T0T7_9CRUS|nr:putative 3',5'-cyclic phosphodiesterase pde-5 [Armadillidium nasatum]
MLNWQSSAFTKVKEFTFYLQRFSFNSLELKEKMVPHLLYMFNDLFGVRNFDKDSLIRFFFTVRKNYRGVPYHNWKHGFCVAHSMYVIIKESPCVFNNLEKLALFIGALCHDMDYRVTTNQFPLESDSPLVDLYSTDSYPESHFSMIVQLLQEELTMTACDISASAKPWKIHVEYVNEVMEEFYKQKRELERLQYH